MTEPKGYCCATSVSLPVQASEKRKRRLNALAKDFRVHFLA